MLFLPTEPRHFLGADALSYSELSTLADCESKWALKYASAERLDTPATVAQSRGKELHTAWAHWWRTGELLPSEDRTVEWVAGRYAQYYGGDRAHGIMRLVEAELPFAWKLGRSTHAFGWVDGLVRVSGLVLPEIGSADGLWVAEYKTTGKIDSILHLEHSLQKPLYILALRAAGYPVRGALLDVACTAGQDKVETKADAYKRFRDEGLSVREAKERSVTDRLVLEPAPLHTSFERRWQVYSDDELAATRYQIEAALRVRSQLHLGLRAPLKNVGPFSCKSCPVVAPCLGLDIEILDEGVEE